MYTTKLRILRRCLAVTALAMSAVAACREITPPTGQAPVDSNNRSVAGDISGDSEATVLTISGPNGPVRYTLTGRTLILQNGRRITIHDAAAAGLRRYAIQSKAMARIEREMAPVWRKMGLPDVGVRVAQLVIERRAGLRTATPLPLFALVPHDGISASMSECNDLALDLYEATVDWRFAKNSYDAAVAVYVDCVAGGGACYGEENELYAKDIELEGAYIAAEAAGEIYVQAGCMGNNE